MASPGVAAALAVLAGIAASDAACCATLGRRSRGQDHREALALLRQVTGGARRRRTYAGSKQARRLVKTAGVPLR